MLDWLRRKDRKDGTHLIATGPNINTSHLHRAPDGTLLSVKENGEDLYNRGAIRRDIRDAGIDIEPGWRSSSKPVVDVRSSPK